VLIVLMLNAAYLRHFFNLRHQGVVRPSILVSSALLFVVTAAVGDRLAAGGLESGSSTDPVAQLSDTQMLALVSQHCANCHAMQPAFPGYSAAPGGIVLDSIAALDTYKMRTISSLRSGYMPLGNMQGLSDAERAAMLRYLE
jgi:uncharacterized membrane protein